jgi:3-methyladenine DNA glycosylase AlkD
MYTINDFEFKDKNDITDFLLRNADEEYREFTAKLTPNIDKESIIGVRVPLLRQLSKKLKNTDVATDFLHSLPHSYLEENHLHGFLIEHSTDFDTAISLFEDFLPYINNWATCDTVRPKIFKKHTDKLFEKIKLWLKSDHTYTVRYAIGLLNSFYLDEHFESEHLQLVAGIKSDEYYINMMIAWYFATALCKQYDDAVKILENRTLPLWVHNKTIQKARESYRIDADTKAYLNTLKIK